MKEADEGAMERNREIKGVAFDLEGTIIDLERLHFGSFAAVANEGGFHMSEEDIQGKIPNAVGGGDQLIAEGISKLAKDEGIDLSPEWILRRKKETFKEMLAKTGSIEMRSGFEEVFDRVIQLGLPVAIGSLTPKAQALMLLEHSGLDKMVPLENVVLLEDVEHKKPAPDVFLETARRLGISPSEQLVFEDSPTGVQAARAAGSPAVAVIAIDTQDNREKLTNSGVSLLFDSWDSISLERLVREIESMDLE